MSAIPRRVAILGGNRIPFVRSNTAYTAVSNQDMLTATLDGLEQRYGLAKKPVGEVMVKGRSQPVEMFTQPEDPPLVDAQAFPHRIPSLHSAVERADSRLAAVMKRPIDIDEDLAVSFIEGLKHQSLLSHGQLVLGEGFVEWTALLIQLGEPSLQSDLTMSPRLETG